MAVVQRYYGLNFGDLQHTDAGDQPITSGVSTTSKHMEVRIDMGDAAGSTAEQAAYDAHKDKGLVLAQLQQLIDQIANEPWPPART